MRRMTMRDRILAVLRGRELDRVPFVQYDGLAAPNAEIWSVVGRDDMGLLRWTAVHRLECRECSFETARMERRGIRGIRRTLHTPAGQLTEEVLYQPELGAPAIREHFVKEPRDYVPLIAYLRDVAVCEDIERLLRDDRELGDDGLPHVALERTPFQQLWVQWVSLEDLCVHMVECPELVEQCIRLMGDILRRIFEVVRKAPVPYVVFPDNITAPVIGERYFRQYCVPFYNELADMLADADVPVFVHMDGDLRPLWQAIGESGVRGLDSLSPPPDNDTSVARAVSMWPEMRVFVNFPSSVHLALPEEVYRRAAEILAEGAESGRLQIQVSENVPPGVWRRSFPEIVRAIRDFGAPGR